jgi:hypothetical protein
MTRQEENTTEADEEPIGPGSCDEEASSTQSHAAGGVEYTWPKAQNLPFIFPHHTCVGIVKKGDVASVTLTFPPNPSLCCLVVDISAKEAQSLSKELFDVQIRYENNQLSIVFDNGALVDIKGSVTLKGVRVVAVDKILGQAVGSGFRQSPPRLQELSSGALLSNCLTMEIWDDPSRSVRLRVMVETLGLDYIRDQLWQSPSQTSQ